MSKPITGYVIASKLISEQSKKVGWMYREAPLDPADTGWRLFSGEEDDAFADDPTNFAIYEIETIIELDSSILEFLNKKIGTEVERNESGSLTEVSDEW